MDYMLEELKARRRQREQWIWELKRKTLEMSRIHPMRYPSMTNILRARQAPRPPCSTLSNNNYTPRPHNQQHPHRQPLRLWLSVEALLVCLTPPMA